MPEPTANPFEFNPEYDAEFDAPIEQEAKPQEVAAKPAGVVAPSPAATGTEAPKHNPMTLHFAKEFGFDDAEIAELTPKELDTAVRLAHKTMLKTSQEFRRNEDRTKPPEPAPVVAPPPPKPEEDDLAEFGDEVAPRVLEAIRKGRTADKKRIEELQAKVDAVEGERQAAHRERLFDAVDAEFAKMPAALKKLIGEGGRADIADQPLAHAVRKHILAMAEADRTEGETFAQKMHKAAKALVPAGAEEELPIADEIPEPAPAKPAPAKTPDGRFASKPVAEREAEWKQAGAAKPTQREAPLPKGERRAMATAKKIMLAAGMLDEADVPADAFPG